jgi:hypothetical protein
MEGRLAPTLAGIREEGEGHDGVKRLNIGLSTNMWVLRHIASSFAVYVSRLGWRGKMLNIGLSTVKVVFNLPQGAAWFPVY